MQEESTARREHDEGMVRVGDRRGVCLRADGGMWGCVRASSVCVCPSGLCARVVLWATDGAWLCYEGVLASKTQAEAAG